MNAAPAPRTQRLRRALRGLPLALLACIATAQTPAPAAEDDTPLVGLHAQATWIRQYKPGFQAPYTGPRSLRPQAEWSQSYTTTMDLGLRLWPGAQLHLNPEASEGIPLSGLGGSGGISNGELQRGGSPVLKGYRARLFLQQRIDAGGDTERIDADFNELGGTTTARRWTLTAGFYSLLDAFDPNPYAKDPREQFANWSFLTHGAWDYAADARGYTFALSAEYRAPGWAVRAGRGAQPKVANGLELDRSLRRQHGDQLEGEADLPWHTAAGPLKARALLFRNRVLGGAFRDAIAAAAGGVPDVTTVRRAQHRYGMGLTLEIPLGEEVGLFVRASTNEGRIETYAFTEIDRQFSVGGQFSGARWGRPQDRWGVGLAVNGISGPHREYLALGGQGGFLGDGALNYGSERIFESWYRFALTEVRREKARLQNAVSLGAQWITNPGYNRDRGPVRVWMLRWHGEF